MNKAVFLDRDGVINLEVGDYIMKTEDFHVHAYAVQNIKRLHLAGFKIVVITNQGGIAKGLYSRSGLYEMHEKMLDAVRLAGAEIDEIYYCPHHPDFGLCLCRKPASLLVEKALAKFNIDPSLSFFIGDKQRDIDAAHGAGVTGILIDENEDWTYLADRFLQDKKLSDLA